MFFHLHADERLSATSQVFPHIANNANKSQYGFARVCLHAPGLEHNEEDNERKEHSIIQIQKNRNLFIFYTTRDTFQFFFAPETSP